CAVRWHAQVELRRARARLCGGRILHPDQNRLYLELAACPTRPPSVPSTQASEARGCLSPAVAQGLEQASSKRLRVKAATLSSSTSTALIPRSSHTVRAPHFFGWI